MEAWLEKNGEVTVVHLRGRVDYETTAPFKEHCVRHLSNEKIVFSLKELSFVGSTGVTDFVSSVVELGLKTVNQIKLASVSNEFRRIFESHDEIRFQVYETPDIAVLAFQGAAVSPLPRLTVEEGSAEKLSF